ncbi:metalloprotease [Brumimicrobium salinarum]|uniref:Metalloprotease n=1 Tax=Brumimicrobium salinarum TaxID=2058658 RepID=A0A2I0R0W2_9FLAO|nr:T9SS-dependent M36 family metallopeptidase [Brumimicrobium salinarum]PKR80207.1 metalloprotease [Brumimicrobium salinarum]
MKPFLKNYALIVLTFIFYNTFLAQESKTQLQAILLENIDKYDLTQKDIQSWEITDNHKDNSLDINYYYLTQTYNNLPIHNAISVIAIKDQKMFLTANNFIANLEQKIETSTASISAKEAIISAANALDLAFTGEIKAKKTEKNHQVFSAKGLSKEDINARLKLFLTANERIKIVWDLDIYQLNQKHWWNVQIDAQTGALLNKTDWVAHCNIRSGSHKGHNHALKASSSTPAPPSSVLGASYNVFAIPVESPNHGLRSIVVDPENLSASPYGWHDTDGTPGAEHTNTFGNNVYASEDRADLDQIGYAPDGGTTLNFDFPLDLTLQPQANEDAVITNLFYMNNIMHDVWYNYGFDESSGNFQKNNYGNGGLGDDHVFAQAQDGGGTNNANFATPPDGNNPVMQMYLWSAPSPEYLTVNSPSTVNGQYTSIPANFGPAIPSTPITADLVMYDDNTANPLEACSPAVNGSALNNKIAIIRRGTCSFVDKVANAEAAGALAVIIVNNVGGTITMGGTDPGIGIPSISVTQVDGEALITEIQNGATINATIVDASPVPLDGDFDNGIIAHEYGHGISNRLTGGASNSSCLNNREQMGEGWSDWFALMLTIEPGDQPEDIRGIGTYATGEPTNGGGIRPRPYSTDFNINEATYAITNNTGAISRPHGIGFVWATMLWDLTWALVDKHGMDPDVYNGSGGNNIAMHLVIQGLKLQGCNPGFIDGRDAIIQADQLLYGGENTCLIWEVFANRGLGYSADQGSNDSRTDQTEAFDLPPYIGTTYGTETISACGSYIWPTNNQEYTASGTYDEYLLNANGCDSIVTLNLTLNTPSSSTISEEVCNSYTWPANGQTYVSSGTYTETLTATNGCDSIVTLNLTVNNQSTSSSITENVCESFTWSANSQTYTSSGTFVENLTSVNGCDSIVTLNLTVNTPSSSTISEEVCNSYTWPANGQTYMSSGTYSETLTATNGCDSTVTLNLTVGSTITNAINENACENFTWPVNGQTYTTSGTYTETLNTINGCDSIITLNLTVNNDISLSEVEEVCGRYTWPVNGQTYTESGIYTEEFTTAAGCDSSITLNLSVSNIDAQVIIDFDDKTLKTASGYANYQWVDCKNGFTPIIGETNATFSPTENGSYAVIINNGNCADTSACTNINILDVENLIKNEIKVYPNPTNGWVKIDFMENLNGSTLKVFDITGKLVQQLNIQDQKQVQFHLEGETGIYILEISTINNSIYRKKLKKLQ